MSSWRTSCTSWRSSWRAIAASGTCGVLLLAACSSERSYIGFEDSGSPTQTFTSPPDGGDASATEAAVSMEVPLCVSTECPAPYATCGDTPTFLCATNLQTDRENCGACGVTCGAFVDGLNMGGRCVDGKCAFECVIVGGVGNFRDCNGILDDGCETDVAWDAANCGACGKSCPAGVRCMNGKCGCSGGKVDCNGSCVDLSSDRDNCGACGNVCEDPLDACESMPKNTTYGCGGGKCGKLVCLDRNADCNGDLSLGCGSDGCETSVRNDPNNCGRCGNVCTQGQECRDQGNGPECIDKCELSGTTQCGQACRDLRHDPQNCGACGSVCPAGNAHQHASCKKGLCALECEPGFADCNGDPFDGCEVDLRAHPGNCGACGHECDIAAGQPCIEGKCLMAPCDAGVETR